MRAIDRMLEALLGPRRVGSLAYRRNPSRGRAWGGPMNGQKWRCLMVADLLQQLDPAAIVETGTYLGTTTDWLAAFKIPLYTCEASLWNYGFSKTRLLGAQNVHVVNADSRVAIQQLLDGPLHDEREETLLFYLDAHWNDDLPLAEEIDLIFRECPNAVAVVDDFQTPGDNGYGYDDYGPGKALIADYITAQRERYSLELFYPSTPSECETGAKRGCVVVAGPRTSDRVAGVKLLRRT